VDARSNLAGNVILKKLLTGILVKTAADVFADFDFPKGRRGRFGTGCRIFHGDCGKSFTNRYF